LQKQVFCFVITLDQSSLSGVETAIICLPKLEINHLACHHCMQAAKAK
jgi:hypothetical protein